MLEWLLGIVAIIISSIIAIAGFFITRWIEKVDEELKGLHTDGKQIRKEISYARAEQETQAKSITETVRAESRAYGTTVAKRTEEMEKTLGEVKSLLYEKVLPAVANYKPLQGKIIHIEERQSELDKKVQTLYDTVKIVVEKLTLPSKK